MPKLFQSIRKKALEGDGIKKYLLYALGEIILVIVGILVALQINNWNEARKGQEQQRVLLSSIRTELITNLELLEAAYERRKPFSRTLDSLSNSIPDARKRVLYNSIPLSERLPGWTGMAPLSLNGAMFEAAKYSDALGNIDIDLLQSLSYTYNSQNSINTIGGYFINKFFDLNASTEVRYGQIIDLSWRIKEEFFGAQFLLMEDYKESIALIDKKLGIR